MKTSQLRNSVTLETYLAVGELAQAAAHFHGLTGPVQFTVCRPAPYEPPEIEQPAAIDAPVSFGQHEEFFYARQSI